jgi:hypothetical protein
LKGQKSQAFFVSNSIFEGTQGKPCIYSFSDVYIPFLKGHKNSVFYNSMCPFLKGYKQKGLIHQKRKGYIRKGKFLLENLFRFIILCEAKYNKEFRIFKKNLLFIK